MAIPVEMPKMSDTMEEGVLVAWMKEEGAEVAAGDVIAQVETDKATMDLEVYDDGVLLRRLIGEGESVPIGALIAVLGRQGEDVSAILQKYGKAEGGATGGDGAAAPAAPKQPGATQGPVVGGEPVEADTPPSRETGQDEGTFAQQRRADAPSASGQAASTPAVSAPAGDGDDRVKASPLARRLAQEHGINLSSLQGSGPEGRVVRRDIEAAMAQGGKAPAQQPTPGQQASQQAQPAPTQEPAYTPVDVPAMPAELYETVKLTQMRKAIARRLSQSKFTSPHFYLTVDVDMEKAIAFRQQLNELAEKQGRPKISPNDLITKACALALRKFPDVNGSWLEKEGEVRRYKQVHVAIAVALPEGLITPVIRNADQKGLGQLAEETRQLADKAKNKQLQPSEYEGSTFTTSNLGMFGIEEFTSIINPPNAAILAIGAILDVPVVKDGQVVPGKRMKLTLSCDHRIVDGAVGAQFLGTVKQFIEEPLNLLL